MRGRLLVVGEALVEIMRPRSGLPLDATGPFVGPFPSGAPAIVADAAAHAGADVALLATVGDDPFGHLLLSRLSKDRVDTSRMYVADDAVTGVAFVAYDGSGGREFVFHVADAAPSKFDIENLGSGPEEAAWLHVSGSSLALSNKLAETVLVTVERVLATGGQVSFDPNLRAGSAGTYEAPPGFKRLLEVASLVFPSEGELEAFGTDSASLARAGAIVCETLGKEGACLHHEDKMVEIAGLETEEVDPTGAGDAFSGTFLAAYMQNNDPERAAQEANAAAAAHVRVQGPMESGSRPSGSTADHATSRRAFREGERYFSLGTGKAVDD